MQNHCGKSSTSEQALACRFGCAVLRMLRWHLQGCITVTPLPQHTRMCSLVSLHLDWHSIRLLERQGRLQSAYYST